VKRILAVMLLAAAVLGLAPGVSAAPSDPGSVRRNLQQKREELRFQRKRLDVVNEREKDLSTQLSQAQAGLQESRMILEETAWKLSSAESRLESIRRDLQATRERLKASQAAMERRLCEIYTEGDVGYLVVLLGSNSFTDFLDHAHYLKILIENDRLLVEQVRRHKAELEDQEAAARSTVAEIRRLKATQEQRVARLARLEETRSNLLASVQSQRQSIASYVVELEGSTRELEDRLRSVLHSEQAMAPSAGRARGTGRYVYPTDGPQTSPFGYRIHPIFGTLRFHSGIDIAAAGGAAIRAADSGTVIHSGWMGGYGNCLIIDHGGGYSTLYAHCSVLYARYGQAVKQGQTVAAVGSTGYSTGPHLHFEVRINGNPVDPAGFI
jgi:murein DD-endopeptidase MepM/ murein hydrolase activator NlpD